MTALLFNSPEGFTPAAWLEPAQDLPGKMKERDTGCVMKGS